MSKGHAQPRRSAAEPVVWLLFSGGGMAAALAIPVLLLLFGALIPLGVIDTPGYEQIQGLLANPVAKLVLFGLFALALWHFAHRFRFTLYHMLQLHASRTVVAVLCYGAAVAGAAVAAVLLLRV